MVFYSNRQDRHAMKFTHNLHTIVNLVGYVSGVLHKRMGLLCC